MRRRIVAIIAAVILAGLGTVALVAYVNGNVREAQEREELTDVWVAKDTIPRGATAEVVRERSEIEQVPARLRADGAVADPTDLGELVAQTAILPGEQIRRARFVEPTELYRVTVEVPSGLLQASIALDPERVLGGNITPGDTVAVVASFEPFETTAPPPEAIEFARERVESGNDPLGIYQRILESLLGFGGDPIPGQPIGNETHILAHKVLVTRIQIEQDTANADLEADAETGLVEAPKEDIEFVVSLAVDAPTLEELVFAQEFGRVWLALEPPDASEEGTRPVNRGDIFDDDSTGS